MAARTHSAAGSAVTLTLRPEKLDLHHAGDPIPEHFNQVNGKVKRRLYFGDSLYYEVDLGPAVVDARSENRPGLKRFEAGENVIVAFHPESAEALTE